MLLHAAKTFKVTNILVIGDDRLTANLKRDLPQVPTERINKSGGVVIRSTHHRRKTRMNKIREYFYGLNDTLSPHSIVVKFEDVCFLKIGGHVAAPKSALPIGAKSSIDPVEMNEVEPTDASLVHGVLGLSQANKKEDVLLSNIAGLVYLYVNKCTDFYFFQRKGGYRKEGIYYACAIARQITKKVFDCWQYQMVAINIFIESKHVKMHNVNPNPNFQWTRFDRQVVAI